MNFAKAAARYASEGFDTDGPNATRVAPQTDRPTTPSAQITTDSLDPAAVGGPAPMNSGQGPYGAPVASDPLLQTPIRPGSGVPYIKGPDADTLTLH